MSFSTILKHTASSAAKGFYIYHTVVSDLQSSSDKVKYIIQQPKVNSLLRPSGCSVLM